MEKALIGVLAWDCESTDTLSSTITISFALQYTPIITPHVPKTE